MAKDIRLISGRIKSKAPDNLDDRRSEFISLDNAEPNLGTPNVDNYILGSQDASLGGARKWLRTDQVGITVDADGSGNPRLKVNESTLPIAVANLQSSGFLPVFDTTLDVILDKIDSALDVINTTAITGSTVEADSNFTGDGTVSSRLALDSTLVINQITQANRIVADSIGDASTILRGDGSNITNFPTDDSAVDSLARNALTGGVGITYTASTGTIDIDSNDNNIVLSALTVKNNVSITGDLTVSGDLTTVNQSQLAIDDALIQLGVGNEVSDQVDIGFVGHYRDASLGPVHTGLFRDADINNKGYYLFHQYIDSNFDSGPAPTTIDRSDSSFALANLNVATLFGTIGDFDSVLVTNGSVTVTGGDITTDQKVSADSLDANSLDANIFTLDSGSILKLRLGTLDSAVGINADSGTITRISFDSIDSNTRQMLEDELVAKDVDDNIDSSLLPDLFLRNDSDDSTTGSITADGGFIGDLDADSADITVLTGDSANFNKLTGRLIGIADSALSADQLTTQRTFQVSGDVTTTTPPTFNGTNNVNMSVTINNGVVDSDALGTDAVSTNKIQDNAVTADKIAPNAVDSDIDLRVTKAFIDALNVDADTLDSLNSLQFLRSDIPDDVEANLTWLDNIQARFGTGGDLKIYHDGTNSYIKDEGTGDLYVLTNGQEVLIKDSASGKLSAEFIPDSAVDLYYNGNLKFETTNTGAKVTGIIEADSGTLNGSRILTTADEGAGNGLDADTLDGLQSTEFLRSNADDSMAGTLHIDDSLSANNITRRNSPVVAGTYGSQIAIPIITVDSSGFLDSVGTVAVDGVDSIQFNDTTGVLTVFTGSGTSLTDSITLDPFTTTDLAEGDNLYYTDSRADSAAKNAFTVTNVIAPGFNTGSNPYGLSYQASTGAWTYNGIDSATILSVVGGSSGGGTGGTSGGTTDLTLNSIKVDSAQIYEYLSVGLDANGGVVAGNQVYFEHIDSVDSAFINVLDVTTISFDSIPDDGTSIVPLYALPPEVTSVGVNGVLPDSVIPQNYLRNDSNDSTTGSVTADGGFFGDLVGDVSAVNGAITTLSGTGLDYDSGDITTLTGSNATFDSLFGKISGTYIDTGTIANNKLINSKVILSDDSNNTQDVNLGETFTIAGGTDINVSVGATRTATVSNASTLATVTGRGNTTTNAITVGNFETTGYIRGPATLTIDPADHDSISGTVRILGDLQVEGTTTTINSTEVSINDKTLTLADSVATAALADGAGIIIDGANATWLYKDVSVTGSDSAWVSNIRIVAPEFSGELDAGNLVGTLPDSVLPAGLQLGGDGTIDSVVIPDLFLRNNGNDSTTGSITADGGFVGNLTGNVNADSADITTLTGDSASFTLFRGDLIGRADSAGVADRWTTARTVTFAGGDVTGSFNIRGDSNVSNINLTIANDAVALGTQTSGRYLTNLTSTGSSITITGIGADDGQTPNIEINDSHVLGLFTGGTGVTVADDSISIGQDVATSADVRFASVIADSVVSIGETTSRDYLTIGGASSNELFGLTFVDPTTATSGGHISYRDSNNTVTLGTITSSVKSHSITITSSNIGIFNDNPGKALDVTGEIRASSTITSSTGFSGSGVSLTDLNAGELTSGTVPGGRITGTYSNLTGVGILDAGQISSGFGNIDIGSSSVTAGSFSGDGASLTSLNATQLTSGTVANNRISGDYTGITGVGSLSTGNIDSNFGNINIGTSIFTGDGSGLFNVDASTLNGIDPEELSRTVVLTDSDNGTGPATTNYFYKVATYSFANDSADATYLYSLMPEETTAAHSGATIISVQVKKGATDHTANVDILAMGGSVPFDDDAFRIVNTASNVSPQLWLQSNIAGVRIKVVELSSHSEGVTVQYNDKSAYGTWQGGTPSTTGTAVVSDGLKYRGNDVFHQGIDLDSATLNNPTITGDLTLGQEVQFLDGSVSGNTLLKHGSAGSVVTTSPSYYTLDSNVSSEVTAGKYIITAQRSASNHITEVNFITTSNGSGVSSTEFGTVYTSTPLFTVEMDVSGGNVRLLVQNTSTGQTNYKFSGTLFFDT